jgi:hypothetical protein
MTPSILEPPDAFVPEPEEWRTPDVAGRSPEAVRNEADDLATALPPITSIPIEADPADVWEQLQETGLDEDDLRGE